MIDGRVNKCIECNKKDNRENRSIKVDYYREYDSKRANNPNRVKAREDYTNSLNGKKSHTLAKKRYITANPLKRLAHQKINNYLRYKPEFRKPCHCGLKAHAHHEDYSKPFEVIWLCPKHHAEEHKRLKQLRKCPDENAPL
jgi:hypothetical protein